MQEREPADQDRPFPGGEDSTNPANPGGQFGEKWGNNYGYGREGEHVEPQPYGSTQPQENEYVERFDPPAPGPVLLDSGPQTGKGPAGCDAATGTLRDDICVQLTQQGELDATGIEFELEERVVILRGRVTRPEDRDLAERVVRSIQGIIDVRNELKVAGG